jgi:DNA-binding response OmpR family regulator/anti-sigma regulatory factor (Ser/Thr protein kinase)
MKVLIAEDDPVSMRLLQSHLQAWNYEVVSARNGQDAWELFEKDYFPLVITDWMMPGVDGLELIRRIRASERPEYVYTFLLTAKSFKEDLVMGMDVGADDFLIKPFDKEELRVRLRAGERVIQLEQKIRKARDELEVRVHERTAELAESNIALQAEMAQRQKANQELVAAQQQLLQAEQDRKRFYREVIRAVTQDRFHLVEADEIPEEVPPLCELPFDTPNDYRALRARLRELGQEASLSSEAVGDWVLAVGEAATNTIKHATEGRCYLFLTADRVIARVSDRGPGIRAEDLPSALLMPGFSTKVSLGMGYTLMLQLVDRLWLSTGTGGTVVQLEKWIHPEEHQNIPLLAALERF